MTRTAAPVRRARRIREREDAADPIDQNKPGPAEAGRRRREKGTDGTTESDHLQLPLAEALVIARVLSVSRSSVMLAVHWSP